MPLAQLLRRLEKLGLLVWIPRAAVVGEELLTVTLADGDESVSGEAWAWESSPWQENPVWSAIDGATSASYTPISGDAGRLLRATVSYSDGSGVGRMASSGATERVDQLGTVAVESRNAGVAMPEVGVWQDSTLSDPDGMVSSRVWRWEISTYDAGGERDWTVIEDAKAGSYKPASGDAGKVIRVAVTYNDGTGTGRKATSLETGRVDQPGTLELSSYSDVAVGSEVAATLDDSDGGVVNAVWQWYSSPKQNVPVWTVIKGAVSASYTPVDGDAERILRVTVAYDDAIGDGRNAESPSTLAVDRPGNRHSVQLDS